MRMASPSLSNIVAPPQGEWPEVILLFRRSAVMAKRERVMSLVDDPQREAGQEQEHGVLRNHKGSHMRASIPPQVASPSLSPSVAVDISKSGTPSEAAKSRGRGDGMLGVLEGTGPGSVDIAPQLTSASKVFLGKFGSGGGHRGDFGEEEAVPSVPPSQEEHSTPMLVPDVLLRLERAERQISRRMESSKRTRNCMEEAEGQGKALDREDHARRDDVDPKQESWFERGTGSSCSGGSTGATMLPSPSPSPPRLSGYSIPIPFTCTLRAETNASTHHIPVFIYDGGVHISLHDGVATERGVPPTGVSGEGARAWGRKEERLPAGMARSAFPAETAGLPPDARWVGCKDQVAVESTRRRTRGK